MASVNDRYTLTEGPAFMTGVQALVRLLLDQHRADAEAGLRTASLVSGYQGSPLGGFDQEVGRLGDLAGEFEVHLQPAVNEELGATAVWGSQLAGTLPGPKFDGVLGVWYGKAPGLDRAADAVRHGNYVGADPRGGVVALVGDDPASKSSTIPGSSEQLLSALSIPVFVPGSVQEALDFGRHAVACSRASGLWAAMKVVTNVADASGTVEVGIDRVTPVIPQLEWEGATYVHQPSAHIVAPESLEMERTIAEVRLELAKRYAELNELNRVIHDRPGAKLGIIASGTAAHDLRRAFAELGFGSEPPARLFQVGMLFPLEETSLREFAHGLDEILVVEEKGPFLEQMVKAALYASSERPLITGKRDAEGNSLLPAHGVLDADSIARAIGSRLLAREEISSVRERLRQLDEVAARPAAELGTVRMPYFCSGCPHGTSTVAPEGEIVGAGVGCHAMVMLTGKNRGKVTGATQMGGEGAQWIGVSPFVDVPHFTQNLGDGTFHHSGSLAVRAAVAADVNVTYKLLFNEAVAMTGGQDVQGAMSVVEAATSLAAEGVKRIIITTDDPSRFAGAKLPAIAEVRDRAGVLEAQEELAAIEGVTVLLHAQPCAAELRRARKRGLAPDPVTRVVINERVCEGCGDCGEKSSCLAVEPVDTEFGRKTRINQTACNKDYSCLKGDCPSFLTVITKDGAAISEITGSLPTPPQELPEPTVSASEDVQLRMVGIGGSGVVTVSQVLGMAALLDGRQASGLDQTGLSQKAGPVVSDMRLTSTPVIDGVTIPTASLDVLLGFDLLGTASKPNLRTADPGRTVAIVSTSAVPTGSMVIDVENPGIDVAGAQRTIDAVTSAERNVYLDAQEVSKRLLGDATFANVVLLGAALQSGVLPVSLGALQEAIRLNGAAVEKNLAALEWGRAAIVKPQALATGLEQSEAPAVPAATTKLLGKLAASEPALRELLEVRVTDLFGWGGRKVARRYLQEVERVRAVEAERIPGSTALSEEFARGLHKLLAYKDEYEVARLHLEELENLPPGTDVHFHLHPPFLRALGMKRKLKLGSWFLPVFRVLRRARALRGTSLDPFGRAKVRQVERALPDEYLALIAPALERLSPETLELSLQLAATPELVRGYEEIKLAGVERFRARGAELSGELGDGGVSTNRLIGSRG